MRTARIAWKVLGGLFMWGGVGTVLAANPTVEQVLKLRPKQENVVYTTPAESDYGACKLEVVKGDGGGSGYFLRDPQGQPLRRFIDTNGDQYIDIWSYYQDGKEVYREVDSNFNKKADQFRWLGTGGMKHGVDSDEDGRIDFWRMISPEEVSQEVLQGIITRDFERLKALMVNDDDLKTLQLPAAETARIKERLAQAPEKFQKTVAALITLTKKTQWMHLETSAPQCIPADTLGGGADLIRYRNGTILYANEGKHDFIQIGEMILVGRAWRITSAPTAGYASLEEETPKRSDGTETIEVSPETQPLLNKLREVDEKYSKLTDAASMTRYNLERADVLEQLARVSKKEADQENWLRQMADCLSTAAQSQPSRENPGYRRLVELRDRVVKGPSQKLAGYVAFREMSADYAIKLTGGKESAQKIQEEWRERLKKFWETFPTADDAPDALLQLGMVSEFTGKETEARNWYETLAKQFPQHRMAKKAHGAILRLESEGKPLDLAGKLLGSGKPFDVKQLQGRVVVVYYWASWNGQCATDFGKLKLLHNTFGSKDVELVFVNLDNNENDAIAFLQRNTIQGYHLYESGALDSSLAEGYGVMVLPNLFLVGKDGKVISRTVQIGGLEDEIRKLLK